jgi:FtsH-binding integral membrane protein
VVGASGIAILAGFRGSLRLSLLAYFATVSISLLALLHVIEYHYLTNGDGPFIQGRYMLPVVSLFGLAVALVVGRMPRRARGPVAAILLVGLVALQVLALATVARTYYT